MVTSCFGHGINTWLRSASGRIMVLPLRLAAKRFQTHRRVFRLNTGSDVAMRVAKTLGC